MRDPGIKSGASPRLYTDLAWLWPYWGSVEHYRPESELFARLIREHAVGEVGTILDMGCGGGKNAYHLGKHFQLTGIDRSPVMLAQAGRLNPGSTFRQGDMRSLDLGETFDAVFVNDSISYMQTPEELQSVFRSAYRHLRPGGVMITYPDHLAESFQQNKSQATPADGDGKPPDLEVVFVENYFDPDPRDTTCELAVVYIIRERGILRIERDLHVLGLFSRETWRRALRDEGFDVVESGWGPSVEPPEPDVPIFVCRKPM